MTPTNYIDRLRAIGACSDAISWCCEYHPTDLRAAWEDCPDGRWMLWLLVRLDRRRGVGALVEVVRALCAHLASDDVAIDVLNPLAAWAAGDDSVDVVAVRARAWEIRRSLVAAAAWAAADADAADVAAAAADADAAMIRDLVPAAEVERLLMEGTR